MSIQFPTKMADNNSIGNLSTNILSNGDSCLVLKPGHVGTIPFCFLMGVLLVKACFKFKHNMEPVNVFDLSILTVQFLWIFTTPFGLGTFQKCFSNSFSPYCIMINFINNHLRFCFYGDFIISQLDKFVALRWSFWYHAWMTNSRAVVISFSCKFLMAGLTLVMMCVDIDYFKCFPKNTIPFCNNLNPNNVFWRTIPVSIVQIVILSVTLYICKVISHLQESNSNLRPSLTTNVNEEETPNDYIEGNNQIRRTNSNPNMFYRHSVCQSLEEDAPKSNDNGCFPITQEFYDFAKRSLNVNLQTLILSILMIPMNVLWVYIYITGESCETQLPRPPGQPFYWPFAYYLTMIAYLGFWFITYKKLSKS